MEMDHQGNANKRKRSPSPSPAGNTSSSSGSGGEYEVFLSFCGKDTRHTFTDFLYNDLIDAGIRTFRDDNELRVGEEIGPELLKAIKESKISIPVFSENYASSKWCLREFAEMIKCRTTLEQKIFPIFYKVEPSEVKHQTGSFEQAFLNHKEHVKGTIVKEWKDALMKVGELKGWEVNEGNNRDEGKLVKKVTSDVLTELGKNYMDVTRENLVGIEDQVEEMKELLNDYSDAVQIVGITGMGGIGKTTLAKVIYYQIFEHFEGCCFLSDVRETSQQYKGLVDLQNELCRKILKREGLGNIANVDEGRDMIKNTVCRKKVLIVLDDVDKKSQIDNLVGQRKWFARGSKIIVTTRDEDVQNWIVVDRTYKPPPMEPNHSLQLFSKHAFKKDFPPEEYVTLWTKFVHIAAGLPLALEIIGSSLYRKDKSYWEGMLKKLEKIPHQNVQKKLKISYDTLEPEEKQIFLDIACFFIKEDTRIAFYMWDACEFYPTTGINALVLRSLIKIRDDNKLWMHDQLRDLGRDIVRCENSNEPWKRSRVWSCKDALETLERCEETQEHEAIKVEAFKVKADSLESYPSFPKEFGQLKRLRYLEVDYENSAGLNFDLRVSAGDANAGDFKHYFPKLRWLKWHKLLPRYKVTNFHLEKLVILDLSWSVFRDNSECWNQIKMAKNLKVLNLTFCFFFDQALDFSTFAALEILILQSCSDLVKIDPSIRNLTSLRVLDISSCRSITELPDAIGNLEKLEEINASNCEKLAKVEGLSFLKSLKVLKMSYCTSLEGILDLSNLGMLKDLDLFECRKLAKVESLSFLKSLEVLDISYCTSLEGILDLSNFGMLKDLNLLNCWKLAKVEGLSFLKSLVVLNMSSCTSLEGILDLSNLGMLENLDLFECRKLAKVECLSFLKSLKVLDLSYCTSLEGILDLSNLGMLKNLDLFQCGKLAKVEGLSFLKFLKVLKMSCCTSLEGILDLSNLGMLENLDLSCCGKLAKVEGLSFLKSLEVLDMSFCTSLEGILDLSNLGMLNNPNLSHCWKLAKVEVLKVSCCISLEGILDVSNLGMLKDLELFRCRKLAKVEGLSFLKSLELLDMSFCTSLEGILDLSNLGMLKKLDLSHCQKLAKVEGLSFLKSLEVLKVSFCTSLEGILDLSNLGMLKRLDLSHCQKLAKVEGLSFLKSLELLNMSFCTSLEGILDLSNLGMLNNLDLSHCRKLAKVEGLSFLKSLELLNMSFCCTSLEGILDLSNLKKLRWLDISGSSKSIENPLDLPNTRIVKDSRCWFRSEAFENEKEDASHGGSDGSDDSDSGENSDWEYDDMIDESKNQSCS